MNDKALPAIRITYCTQCHWLLRAGWMAQELLSTFGTELGEVALVPGTGGIFTITCNDQLIWDMVAFVRQLPKMSPEQYQVAVASAPAGHDEMMEATPGPSGADHHADGSAGDHSH